MVNDYFNIFIETDNVPISERKRVEKLVEEKKLCSTRVLHFNPRLPKFILEVYGFQMGVVETTHPLDSEEGIKELKMILKARGLGEDYLETIESIT